jgi:putative ABC transport system permease protein
MGPRPWWIALSSRTAERCSPPDILSRYQSRVSIAQIPVICMLVLIAALMLFFVSMIADLLVERESETIALLRSRGISRTQILGIFATQGLLLALLALLGGTLCAVYLAQLLTRTLLPGGGQNVLDLVTGNPLPLMWSMRWPALITALAGLIALLLALLRPLRSNILALRREMARTNYRPLWRRFNLDIAALVLMVASIATSAYFINSNVLNVRLQELLLTPLAMLEAACLVIAAILLFLRFFPQLLRFGTTLAARRLGAGPLLAMAQLARSPRQPLQMTLLLALATAFALFSLVFMTSQEQRPVDVAAYTGGADFSGPLATPQRGDELAALKTAYQQIPGVISASPGFSGTASAGGSLNVPAGLLAVDTHTFAQSSIWTPQDSEQSPETLMNEQRARSAWGEAHQMVPAIIDDAAAQALHLSEGSTLVLSVVANAGKAAITNTFVVIDQVHHIPSIISSAQAAGSPQTSIPAGGVLVDFQTYADILARGRRTSASTSCPSIMSGCIPKRARRPSRACGRR